VGNTAQNESTLVEMGFDIEIARQALQSANGNLEQAIALLLTRN